MGMPERNYGFTCGGCGESLETPYIEAREAEAYAALCGWGTNGGKIDTPVECNLCKGVQPDKYFVPMSVDIDLLVDVAEKHFAPRDI